MGGLLGCLSNEMRFSLAEVERYDPIAGGIEARSRSHICHDGDAV
jgi:hypothetical protein